MNGPPPSAFPVFDGAKSAETDALTLVGLTVAYRMRGRDREVLTGHFAARETRRSVWPGRRVGMREIDGGARRAALPASQRPR